MRQHVVGWLHGDHSSPMMMPFNPPVEEPYTGQAQTFMAAKEAVLNVLAAVRFVL